jgi:hypothetical protein
MDSLKLIPSVFFDAIARVVPGAAAIFGYLVLFTGGRLALGHSWSSILERYLGSPFGTKDSLLISAALFMLAAYVVGQLLSPYAKLVQRIGESKPVRDITESKFIQRIGKRLGFNPKPMPNAPSGAYDWLRIHGKEAGAQCAKIRAEFTMHNGLAVVFLASSLCYPAQMPDWDWRVLLALLVATLSAAVRGRTTRDTFEETVKKFADAAGYKHGEPRSHEEGHEATASGKDAA